MESFVCMLQQCRKNRNLANAKRLYEYISNNGLEAHKIVGNHIVPMFIQCGSLLDAQEAFIKLMNQNVHSWTSLILGHIGCEESRHALGMYRRMLGDGINPSSYTLTAMLVACTRIKDADEGRQIHVEIAHQGFESDIFVGNTLISMYAKFGLLAEAQDAFNRLEAQDVISWTALIAGYAENGCGQEALQHFEQMQQKGVSPDAMTYVCGMKACGSLGAIYKGRELHAEVIQSGFERDIFVGNSLVDMYGKCGSLREVEEVFDNLPLQDNVSWTSLMLGYAEFGPGLEALKCVDQMKLEGICLDAVTFICSLKACGNLRDIDKGHEIHSNISKRGLERDPFIGSALVDMYVKCGVLEEARRIFDKLPFKDDISWNALIAGYAERGLGREALKCFEQMQLEGASPDAVTYACILKACGCIGMIGKGRELHSQVVQKGFENILNVGNSLVDMYGKCGSAREAQKVFDRLPVRDVISWNALIRGYGINHEGDKAVQCFVDMQRRGIKPDAVTFICLLTACSRACMTLKSQESFKMMREGYGITPTTDHYTCVIDSLARSGHMYAAEKLLRTSPILSNEETWTALLSACKTYGETDIALRSFQQLVQINPRNAISYVLMGSIYASIGKWRDADRIDELRKHAGAKKIPARALIEVNKKIHEFVVGDNQSEEVSGILEILSSRLKDKGYMPNVDLVLRPISSEEKEAALCGHAEKLAIAFGLLNTPQGQTLHVTKSLRMCIDCHNACKIISTIEKREIILRESNWVHHFKSGLCSCGDMW